MMNTATADLTAFSPSACLPYPHDPGDVPLDQGDLPGVREPPADVVRGVHDLDSAPLPRPWPLSSVTCRGIRAQLRASSSSHSFGVLSVTRTVTQLR
jgi:hypothetical protein